MMHHNQTQPQIRFSFNNVSVLPKLRTGQSNNSSEQEADIIAEKVVATSNSDQENIAAAGCSSCELKRKFNIEKGSSLSSSTTFEIPKASESMINNIGSGIPLSESTRVFMNIRFGADFGKVRIHTDEKSAESARSINALAYTVGNDIVFDTGRYSPDTSEGRRLLAHELTHVVQQQPNLVQRQESGIKYTSEDDSKVEYYIKDALGKAGYDVEDAFEDLQGRRALKENCGDLNLAAAEHYLFARYMVEETWVPAAAVISWIYGYGLAKSILGHRTPSANDVCPATPSSEFQRDWGASGVADGLLTYYTPRGP